MERSPRPKKVATVDELKERFDSSSAILLTEYRGLKVSQLETLRRRLRASGGEYKIFKNTFVRFVANDKGLTDLVPLLEGPTGIAFVDTDAAEVAKAIREFSRENPALIIKGGVLGETVIGVDEVTALAELPSRDVLLARIAGGLAAPMQKFAGLLKAVPQSFAYALAALIEKGGTAGVPVATPTEKPVPEVTAEESGSGEVSPPEVGEPQAEG
ncbi:MAG: 50S ribosomal protein L10 [Actinomycetota bacterium]|nr:50S ribosomal protein L10 [Actinomycetota bacterium]